MPQAGDRRTWGRVLAGIPGSRYVELPDASHGVPIQYPDRINTLLIDHLAAVEAGAESVRKG
jgi:pimeloyl-ACP methyl ester carboxylesterase